VPDDNASADNGGSTAVVRARRRARELVESDFPADYGSAPSDLRLARHIEAHHVGDLSILALSLLSPRTA
jgi:hypothetical protein